MTTTTTVLAAAPGAADSSDVIVNSGATVSLTVTGAGTIQLQKKLVSGYDTGETLGGTGRRWVQVSGPFTFRASRPAESSAGLEMEAA
jgi:hypothetical protein